MIIRIGRKERPMDGNTQRLIEDIEEQAIYYDMEYRG